MNDRTRTDAVLDVLRRPSRDQAVFRGFGPLVVGAIFLLLMILMLPSVAPERIVEREVRAGTEEPAE